MPKPTTRSESGGSTHAHGVKERLREELRHYLIVSAYLFVCFGAIQLYKSAVLRDVGIEYLPLGFVAAKALIIGKFLLLGEAANVGTRLAARTLLQRIVQRVLLLLAFLVALVFVEELIVGWLHGRGAAETLADYDQRLPEVAATVLLVLLVLVPLIALRELDRAMGPGMLRRLLSSRPGSDSGPGSPGPSAQESDAPRPR